jgi:hypothetical protein
MSALPCSCGHNVWTHGIKVDHGEVGCYVEGCGCGSYDGITHVLLPNMSYACGGNILTKVGASRCGPGGWSLITCPDCRAFGQDYLAAVVRWMQGHGPHPDEIQAPAPEHHAVLVGDQLDLFGGAA